MENRESGERSSSPDHSCVSLKSDESMGSRPLFSNDPVTSDHRIFKKTKRQRSSSPEPSCWSMKSARSMPHPPLQFSNEPVTSDPRVFKEGQTGDLQQDSPEPQDDVLQRVKEQLKTSMKNNRITLMFSDAQKVCDVTETSSVAVLMSELMKGELLPSALIWITSRPAAANQIPSKYIHRLTEIQGFTEPQKEEYFRKRISDEHQASQKSSTHRRARSLHIVPHSRLLLDLSTVLQSSWKKI
ncbi:hypothetical protein cypCar_00041938 [Cyprinus carpio]|nr:hypothetical protein cypCar_00041938 [Cyprinus carpio]